MHDMTRDEWDDDQVDIDRKIRLEEAAEQRSRQLMADTLRRAADDMTHLPDPLRPYGKTPSSHTRRKASIRRRERQAFTAWLRARADRIERGVL